MKRKRRRDLVRQAPPDESSAIRAEIDRFLSEVVGEEQTSLELLKRAIAARESLAAQTASASDREGQRRR